MQWSFSTEVVHPPLTLADMDEIDHAFDKVWTNLERL